MRKGDNAGYLFAWCFQKASFFTLSYVRMIVKEVNQYTVFHWLAFFYFQDQKESSLKRLSDIQSNPNYKAPGKLNYSEYLFRDPLSCSSKPHIYPKSIKCMAMYMIGSLVDNHISVSWLFWLPLCQLISNIRSHILCFLINIYPYQIMLF